MLAQWSPCNNTFVFAPSPVVLTFIKLTDKEAVQCPMAKGSVCACGGGGWRLRGEETREKRPGNFPLFFLCFAVRQGGRKEQTSGRGQRGGASDFFRCLTFRRSGDNLDFTHVSQGQALPLVQTWPALVVPNDCESLPALQQSPRLPHVNINRVSVRIFAWKPIINGLNQWKWCLITCNVNALKTTPQMIKKKHGVAQWLLRQRLPRSTAPSCLNQE